MKLRLIILISILAFNSLAQTANPKRTVLFTMLPTEHIYADEYFLAQSSSARKFSCILIDETKNNLTFVFNGTRIKTVPGFNPLDVLEINYLNSTETNGYKFRYVIKDNNGKEQHYMNCFGENLGPYERAEFYTPWEYSDPAGSEKIYFYYELGGRWYAKTPTKNILLFKGDNYSNPTSTSKSGPYDYKWINDNYYITYNGVVRNNQTFSYIWDFHSKAENFAFCYSEEGFDYININNEIFGPLRKVSFFETTDFNSYSFYYNDNDGIWHYINGDTNVKTRFSGSTDSYLEELMSSGTNIDIYSENLEHTMISDYRYEYVVIDGESYGKSPAFQAWYDSDKKSFIWSGIEGNELVVYEFKL